MLDTAEVWVLFLIPARWWLCVVEGSGGTVARCCSGAGIIFNTRKVVGGFVGCALDGDGGIMGLIVQGVERGKMEGEINKSFWMF